ncbi:MAG TPA: trehalose-phosphatase [Gammaproteobacteria bacterium]|nr:trehalose-phosphatase [Gammaproteobacteria bacterium]
MPTFPQTLPDDPTHLALFLDVDGTLLPLAETPADVHPDANVGALLERLRGVLGGALALVSGRPLGEIDRLFAPQHFAAAGQHGAEWRDAAGTTGKYNAHLEELDDVRPQVLELAAGDARLLLEDKGLTLAVHFRRAPERARDLSAALAAALAVHPALTLQHGKCVLEVRPAGCGKDTAIRRMLDAPPFAGRLPLFAGDDATDEDGFRFINALGGCSIKVGAGASNACYRLADPHAMRAWLAALAHTPVSEAITE